MKLKSLLITLIIAVAVICIVAVILFAKDKRVGANKNIPTDQVTEDNEPSPEPSEPLESEPVKDETLKAV